MISSGTDLPLLFVSSSRLRQTTIRLTNSLIGELNREADEQGITRSEHIRQILSERHETTVNTQRLGELKIDYVGADRLERIKLSHHCECDVHRPKII